MGVRIEQEDDVFEKMMSLKEEIERLWRGCPSMSIALATIDSTAYFMRKCREEHRKKEMADGAD